MVLKKTTLSRRIKNYNFNKSFRKAATEGFQKLVKGVADLFEEATKF